MTIEASLLSLFGYKSNDLHTSIFILLKSQMIESVIDRNGSHTSIIFSLTGKGRICLKSLIFNMAYLEHVFHKTLFPARMLRLRSDDQPRQASVFRWSVRSIANVYAFVCYINFVENNNASGKAVPAEFRISSRIAESVYSAVSKILETEARSHQIGYDSSSATLDMADEAWRRLDGQVNIWRINGLVA